MHYSCIIISKTNENIVDIMREYDENENLTCNQIVFTLKDVVEDLRTTHGNTIKSYLDTTPEADVDDNGNITHPYNPNGKFDWYEIGGRYADFLRDKNTGEYKLIAKVKEIDLANLDPDTIIINGDWIDRTETNWNEIVTRLFEEANPDDRITIIDYHL